MILTIGGHGVTQLGLYNRSIVKIFNGLSITFDDLLYTIYICFIAYWSLFKSETNATLCRKMAPNMIRFAVHIMFLFVYNKYLSVCISITNT